MDNTKELEQLDGLFDELFPICRSITGPGLRKSLNLVSEHIPLEIEAIESGTQVFDWEVPNEWHIHEAKLVGPDGETYADFEEINLAVVNYSEPVDKHLNLEELDSHLYTNPDVPEAIPYVTSYYDRTWGFCLPHGVYQELPQGEYYAYIDSEFVEGELNYGHAKLEGESDKEVLLSSYLCHPSLANNELSGPLVLTSLYHRLKTWESRRYTYRFVLCPETIGSITYLFKNGTHLKENLVGGLVLTCLGGPKEYLSYKTSRKETSIIDKIVQNLSGYGSQNFEVRPFTPTRGSDERQYCSPGFDLPVGQIARTVYAEYDGYHNSLDDKEFMGIDSLVDSSRRIEQLLQAFEYAGRYRNRKPFGEPMLGKRNLYRSVNSPTTVNDSTDNIRNDEREFLDRVLTILNYSDGEQPIVDIADRMECCVLELIPIIKTLQEEELLVAKEEQ